MILVEAVEPWHESVEPMWVRNICAYVPPYHHSIFLHTNSEKSSKCRLEPTQFATTSKKLCRRHGPIWPRLERHGVSSATCRDMSATFPAKLWSTLDYFFTAWCHSPDINSFWFASALNSDSSICMNCRDSPWFFTVLDIDGKRRGSAANLTTVLFLDKKLIL